MLVFIWLLCASLSNWLIWYQTKFKTLEDVVKGVASVLLGPIFLFFIVMNGVAEGDFRRIKMPWIKK